MKINFIQEKFYSETFGIELGLLVLKSRDPRVQKSTSSSPRMRIITAGTEINTIPIRKASMAMDGRLAVARCPWNPSILPRIPQP